MQYLAEALARVIEERVLGTLHIAAADSCSKYEFGLKLARAFDLDTTVFTPALVATATQLVARPKNMTLASKATAAALNWAMPTVDQSISRYAELERIGYQTMLRAAFNPA